MLFLRNLEEKSLDCPYVAPQLNSEQTESFSQPSTYSPSAHRLHGEYMGKYVTLLQVGKNSLSIRYTRRVQVHFRTLRVVLGILMAVLFIFFVKIPF